MWTPDVYQGSATPVTAFFATAPKLTALCMLINILYGPLSGMQESWYQIVFFVSMASIALGTFSAIRQTNIKRLLAYSSIAHMGFALIGLLSFPNSDGVQSLLIYMLIYLATTLGVFSCIISLEISEGESINEINDLSGISKKFPFTAFTMAMFMFSYAGIPPLGGFFAKYFIFRSAIESGLIFLSIFGLLLSVVGAFYYIRIIKLMYFDEPKTIITKSLSKSLSFTNIVCIFFIVFFIFIITIAPITELTKNAAIALGN
jgi:NADH-quinone oxidoreductase subunit N